jgi:hypothetical protein
MRSVVAAEFVGRKVSRRGLVPIGPQAVRMLGPRPDESRMIDFQIGDRSERAMAV